MTTSLAKSFFVEAALETQEEVKTNYSSKLKTIFFQLELAIWRFGETEKEFRAENKRTTATQINLHNFAGHEDVAD